MATIAILQIMNKVATIDVSLVKKVPTDLADVKLSCETLGPVNFLQIFVIKLLLLRLLLSNIYKN